MSDEQSEQKGATAALEAIVAQYEEKPGEKPEAELTLGLLFDHMRERAFGVLLLLLALPCCLPFVYLLPQIVALPMILICAQMALGRSAPWLPERLRKRVVPVASLADVVRRAKKYLGFFERLAHQRMSFVTSEVGSRVVGALLLIPTTSILVPLPLTNTLPGIAVAIVSVGLIERDGLMVIGGLVLGLAWVAALVIGGQAAISAAVDLVRG